MADNETTGTGKAVATVKVTFSGDADQNLQLMVPCFYTGAEGSRVVVDLIKLEDSSHTDGDPGIPMLGVRNDADAARIGSDGEYGMQSFDAGGNANVRVRPALTKINVQSAGLTTAATAYSLGDQVGNQFTFAGAARASGGGGYITGVVLKSKADTIGTFDLVLLNATATLAADNAAYAITDTEALTIEAYINLTGAYDIGANRVCVANNIRIPYKCAATSLFGGLICRSVIAATPFGAATDIDLTLYVELD